MSYKLELNKDHQIRVLLCSPKATLPAAIGPFVEQVQSQPAFSFHQSMEFADIAESIPADQAGAIVILCLQDKEEFVQVLQFLTAHESRIQQGLVKVLVFSRLDHPRVLSILKSKGVSEFPEFNINFKAFGYKIKSAVQMIEQSIETSKRQVINDGQTAALKASRSQIGPRGVSGYKVNWESPIEHFSDFWLLLHPRHARHVIGKWMINYYGPGPSAGSWELTSLEENGEKGWMFNPRLPTDQTFYKDAGRWVFFGNCPEFSWEQKIWYFIAKKPGFHFYNGSEIVHKKISFSESGDIHVASNSEMVKSLKPLMTSTIEASVRLHSDREKKKGNVVFENDLLDSQESGEEVEPGSGIEFDYRGSEDAGTELNGSFSNERPEELDAVEDAYDATDLQISITARNGVKLVTEDPIKLVELRDKQAIIDIPIGLLIVGDLIEVAAQVQTGKKIHTISFTASTKIVETEMTDGGSERQTRAVAVCELDQVIKGHFTGVVDQLQAKKELLDLFFRKAKGA